jgi:cyclic AMP-responsive element-binding protein 3
MEVLESGEQSVLQWDRKLSELSEPGETEALMYHTVRTRGPGKGSRG